jgi:hypothetical protein
MHKTNLPRTPQRSGVSRRQWLRGVGVTIALPLLGRDLDARTPIRNGSTSEQAMRMVCVANPLGFVGEDFFPTKAGKFDELPRLLKPLKDHRENMTVISNLDHRLTGGHQSVHAFLSGIRDNESSSWANRNVTLDQIAAEKCIGKVRFPSIVASVGANSGELECRTSWTRTGVNVPPITQANRLFKMLFANETKQQRTEYRRVVKENSSVLDAVFRQANDLKRELGTSDQRKLDEYLNSVRSVEKGLVNADQWIDTPKPNVDLPEPSDGGPFTQRLPLFYDLLALALQTDSTRVATLSIPGNLPVTDLGLSGNYHAFSHHGKTERLRKPLFKIEQYQMQQFSRFLAKLGQLKSADDRPLLDSTMVLCGSGMGNASSHSNKNLPILLAGGGFKHGQHVIAPQESHRRTPLCNLFTTMLQQFGCEEIEKFSRATGTMSELQS